MVCSSRYKMGMCIKRMLLIWPIEPISSKLIITSKAFYLNYYCSNFTQFSASRYESHVPVSWDDKYTHRNENGFKNSLHKIRYDLGELNMVTDQYNEYRATPYLPVHFTT